MKALSEQSHYEILELAPGCPAEQVQAAARRARELYGEGALATYALAEPTEAAALLRRIEEAAAVLGDADRRRSYDQTNGFPPETARAAEHGSHEGSHVAEPELAVAPKFAEAAPETAVAGAPNPAGAGAPNLAVAGAPNLPVAAATRSDPALTLAFAGAAPPASPATAATPGSAAPSPATEAGDPAAEADKPVRKTEAELPADAPVTGEALRRVREARGLSLKDLEARTKIGHWHLENIERERFAALPAQVYLRGFLMSVARELKIDPLRVARSYLEQLKGKLQKPE